MLSNLQYLIKTIGLPEFIAIAVILFLVVVNFVGEILEFKGKIVPEFMKIRKYFARKKHERQTITQMPETLARVQQTLDDFLLHYSMDNITKRDNWIEKVDAKLDAHDEWRKEFDKKLDKNNADTLDLLIESKRNTIINFASYVAVDNNPVTREQFNRIFKIHADYEKIIGKNKMTNGEVDIAMRIINESYENHMKNHTFIEDIRGY